MPAACNTNVEYWFVSCCLPVSSAYSADLAACLFLWFYRCAWVLMEPSSTGCVRSTSSGAHATHCQSQRQVVWSSAACVASHHKVITTAALHAHKHDQQHVPVGVECNACWRFDAPPSRTLPEQTWLPPSCDCSIHAICRVGVLRDPTQSCVKTSSCSA